MRKQPKIGSKVRVIKADDLIDDQDPDDIGKEGVVVSGRGREMLNPGAVWVDMGNTIVIAFHKSELELIPVS